MSFCAWVFAFLSILRAINEAFYVFASFLLIYREFTCTEQAVGLFSSL